MLDLQHSKCTFYNLVYRTCDFEKSFVLEKTVEITSHVYFSIHV